MSQTDTSQRPRITLYQPDIPGNTGTIMRLAACLDLTVDVIEPAGFRLDDPALRRSGMDYLERATLKRHEDWAAFEAWRKLEDRRLVLLTTKAQTNYIDFEFMQSDCLLFGRESAGVPDIVYQAADAHLRIEMADAGRSLNVAVSAAMVVGEALRQIG